MGDQKFIITSSAVLWQHVKQSRLHLQSLAPTNPHWARMVDYGPFSLCVIHKEGLCPSRGDINKLMMMMMMMMMKFSQFIFNICQLVLNLGLIGNLVWCP
jgi:hypothetical protein